LCKEIVEKSKCTKLSRYGDSGYHNYEQMLQTNFEKYGSEMIQPNLEKRKQTSLKHFGVDHPSKAREVHIKMAKTRANAVASDGTKLDSGWEVLVYNYAKQKGYQIERQIPIVYNNGQMTFIDFKINGKLYEVKGTHLLKNCWEEAGVNINEKLKCYQENNVTIITDTNKLDQEAIGLTCIDVYNLAF
jgi:hypothetical protein